MSQAPNVITKLSGTLSLCQYTNPRSGHFGFWLWDETQGMNLAIREKTETDALVMALHYYQRRLANVEQAHKELTKKVDSFLVQFDKEDE